MNDSIWWASSIAETICVIIRTASRWKRSSLTNVFPSNPFLRRIHYNVISVPFLSPTSYTLTMFDGLIVLLISLRCGNVPSHLYGSSVTLFSCHGYLSRIKSCAKYTVGYSTSPDMRLDFIRLHQLFFLVQFFYLPGSIFCNRNCSNIATARPYLQLEAAHEKRN